MLVHGLFQGEQSRLFCPLSFICCGTAHLLYLRPERSLTGKQHQSQAVNRIMPVYHELKLQDAGQDMYLHH